MCKINFGKYAFAPFPAKCTHLRQRRQKSRHIYISLLKNEANSGLWEVGVITGVVLEGWPNGAGEKLKWCHELGGERGKKSAFSSFATFGFSHVQLIKKTSTSTSNTLSLNSRAIFAGDWKIFLFSPEKKFSFQFFSGKKKNTFGIFTSFFPPPPVSLSLSLSLSVHPLRALPLSYLICPLLSRTVPTAAAEIAAAPEGKSALPPPSPSRLNFFRQKLLRHLLMSSHTPLPFIDMFLNKIGGLCTTSLKHPSRSLFFLTTCCWDCIYRVYTSINVSGVVLSFSDYKTC